MSKSQSPIKSNLKRENTHAKIWWNSLSAEEQEKIKEHLLKIRNPAPALGKSWKLSEETKKRQGDAKRGRKVSQATREKMSVITSERIKNGSGQFKSGRPCSVGKREDLGLFLRSKWEANYARYLNWLVEHKQIVKWEYEADEFWFEKIKLGTRRYLPDFKIFNNDGTIEYHEVKGWMDQKSRTKLKRMAKYYPDVKIIIIDGEFMKDLKSKFSRMLPNWET